MSATVVDVPAARILPLETRDGWTIIRMFIPVPLDNPNDAMYLHAFARFDGTKLLEWTTIAPPCFLSPGQLPPKPGCQCDPSQWKCECGMSPIAAAQHSESR